VQSELQRVLVRLIINLTVVEGPPVKSNVSPRVRVSIRRISLIQRLSSTFSRLLSRKVRFRGELAVKREQLQVQVQVHK
jgi:hypothetical protein